MKEIPHFVGPPPERIQNQVKNWVRRIRGMTEQKTKQQTQEVVDFLYFHRTESWDFFVPLIPPDIGKG